MYHHGFELTTHKASPSIFNIIENQALVYYKAKRLLQYFGPISDSTGQITTNEQLVYQGILGI